jgi:RimJ/RimL family protein N-acetyltransferase
VDQTARIRPFEPTDQDYHALATIAASFEADQVFDYEFRAAAPTRALDQAFSSAGRPLTRYLAERAGRAAGYAYYFEIAWTPPAGRYWCVIRVRPEHQRQGIGGQLYARVLADLTRLGATALQLEAHEHSAALVAPLERRGFRELLRSWPFTLEVRGCDLSHFHGASDRLAGLEITTLAQEQAGDPAWLPKLYALHTALAGDVPIPGYPLPAPPLAWFAEHVGSLPEAFFIVRDGERYVAECYMHASQHEPGILHQGVTAVDRAYRGRGIALALKLKTIEFAQRHGYTAIHTGVESNNPSMLAINARLGFEQQPGLILFEKSLRDDL